MADIVNTRVRGCWRIRSDSKPNARNSCRAKENPRGSTPPRAHVRQPRTTVVKSGVRARATKRGHKIPGLASLLVNETKGRRRFVRFRWGETRKTRKLMVGASLMIENWREFRSSKFSTTMRRALKNLHVCGVMVKPLLERAKTPSGKGVIRTKSCFFLRLL